MRVIAGAIAILIALRIVGATVLPLSFDEAYYWLWSKNLALSYYDHPPLIAYAIRLGTTMFGDSAFAVRSMPLLFSVVASWAVWRAADILLDDEQGGALACLFFNLTLMATVETMTATPDAPLTMAAALFVWALAKLEKTQDWRWWFAVGAAGGLALLSKYTALFLGLGAGSWLVFTREGRRWIATPWPYLGMALAFVLFAPVILWNAGHDWSSFRFQFGKTGAGHFAPHFLVEFLAGQIALATPFIFVLGLLGLARRRGTQSVLLLALVAPSAIFFAEHALHARVQGNWPSFLYPAFAIAAAKAALWTGDADRTERVARFARRWAVPTAILFLAVVYGQAIFGFLPMRDPTARLLATGFEPVAQRIEALRHETKAEGVLTAAYATTGWLAFYLPSHPPIVQINEEYRWLAAPKAEATLLSRPLLYVTEPRHEIRADLARSFSTLRLLGHVARMRHGRVLGRYDIYLVSGFHGDPRGRITNGS